MESNPLISVIMPAHNNANTVAAALDSLLAQTYKNLEIIVVDDFSTDETPEIAKRYAAQHESIHFFASPIDDKRRINSRGRNINAGYSARNYGLSKAQGEWITFQDADDASLRNRIEIQYTLAQKYGAFHLCLEWLQLTPERLGKSFDAESALAHEKNLLVSSEKLIAQAKRTRGLAMGILGPLRKYIPFEIKRARFINRLFFGSLDSYPGTGNSPLFKKEITEKVLFRQSDEREWPSFTGRGADRDFNFRVALTYKKSICIRIPLYLYRVERENDLGYDFSQYLQP